MKDCSFLLRKVAVIMLLVMAAASCAGRSRASADEVGAAFLNAVAKGNWSDAGRFIDLARLDSARRTSAQAERVRRAIPAMTIVTLMKSDPDLSPSVAAYQLKQIAKQRSRSLLTFAFGVSDPDSLIAMPIERLSALWVEVHDQRWQIRMIDRDCDATRDNDGPAPSFHILGTFLEDDRAYVVYVDTTWQRGVGPLYAPGPRVIQLRLVSEGWKILPRADLIGLPDMVNACG